MTLCIATAKRAAILKGEVGIGKKRDMTFDRAKEEFLAAAQVNTRPNTYRGYSTNLETMTGVFGGMRLSKITPFTIEGYKKKRMDAGVTVAFNRELGTLKTMFNWATDNGKFDGANPCRRVKKLPESKGRERFLEPEEEEKLLAACAEPLRTIVMCGIYAGLRIPSEVLHLKWADVDLRNETLTILGAFSKTKITETIPLNSRLLQALAGLRKAAGNDAEYVFTRESGEPFKSIQNIFRDAAATAGLQDISPHVCRHTFASRLGMRNADLRSIQRLGRWANLSMVQRYANLSETHLSEVIEKLSENSPTKFPTAEKPASRNSTLKAAVND
jgi:integrase